MNLDLDKVLKKYDISLLEIHNGVKAELYGIGDGMFISSARTTMEAIKQALEDAGENPLEFSL